MFRNPRLRLLPLLCLILAGCDAAPNGTDITEPGAGPPIAAAEEVTVEIKSWDEVQQWVQQQQGKVVVIDVWSTFCLTCMKEFPHFVELHNQYPDQVACASLSVDFYGGDANDPEDVKPAVIKFLRSRNATMANFISSDADSDVLAKIDTAAIPAALIYDQEGKLHKVFNNDDDSYGDEGFNYPDHIIPLVDELLKK